MGFWDNSWEGLSVVSGSRKSHHHGKHHSSSKIVRHKSRSRSRSRSSSRHRHHSHNGGAASVVGIAASVFGGDSHHHKHNSSRSSFFGLPNASRSGFFGSSRPSYYKRSPRHGFMHRALKQIKRLFRDLVYYAKRHPMKVVMLVLMPLITGGALTALLARFGLRLPPSLERMLGLATKAATGDGIGLVGEAVRMAGQFGAGSSVSIERGREGDMQWERRHVEKDGLGGIMGDGLGGLVGGGLGQGLMGVAKMFV